MYILYTVLHSKRDSKQGITYSSTGQSMYNAHTYPKAHRLGAYIKDMLLTDSRDPVCL